MKLRSNRFLLVVSCVGRKPRRSFICRSDEAAKSVNNTPSNWLQLQVLRKEKNVLASNIHYGTLIALFTQLQLDRALHSSPASTRSSMIASQLPSIPWSVQEAECSIPTTSLQPSHRCCFSHDQTQKSSHPWQKYLIGRPPSNMSRSSIEWLHSIEETASWGHSIKHES